MKAAGDTSDLSRPDSPLSPSPPCYRLGYSPGKLLESHHKIMTFFHHVESSWIREDSEDSNQAYLLPSEIPLLNDSPLNGPKEKMANKNPYKRMVL